MKTLTFFLGIMLFALVPVSVYSQTIENRFVPGLGATWHYSARFMDPTEGYFRMEYVADTLIQGKMCKKMEIADIHPQPLVETIDYTYAYLLYEDRKIFEYRESEFNLLYDFNVKKGDVITTKVYAFYSDPQLPTIENIELTIDAVRDTVIQGKTLVCYEFHNEKTHYWYETPDGNLNPDGIRNLEVFFRGTAIEGLGNIVNYFFPKAEFFSDYWQPTDFRCYNDRDFQVKSTQYVTKGCDYLYVYTSLPEMEDDMKIDLSFPDPNTILLTTNESGIISYFIYDIHGKQLVRGETGLQQTQLDISSFSSGLYLLRVNDRSQTKVFKFLK